MADLGRYGNIGVNNSTGVPEITIPIYTLALDEVSLPISLSYNASGVRVTDIASEVGLKWNLNTGGVISRTIRGLPDERAETGWFSVPAEYQVLSSWRSDINCYQEQLRILSENLYDPLPDMFDYVLGEFSGSFQFSRSKSLYKDIKNELKIEPYFDANGNISSITIIDKFGVTYLFGGTGYTETCTTYNHNKLGVFNESRSADGVTSWRLQKIITRSNNEIIFTYADYPISYILPAEEVYHFKLPLPSPISEAYSEYTTDYSRTIKLLTKMETPAIKVEFLNTLDPSASIWQKKIYEIKISDKILNKTRSYLLEYEYYSGSARLMLKRIKEKGTSGGINDKITTFNYDTRVLASYASKSVDYFGFFNNASNTHFVPVVYNGVITDTVANRDVVASEITRGILTEIIYPTGGKSKFYYEPNKSLNAAGKVIYAAGVRVQKIEEIGIDNTISNTQEYTYSGLVGNIQEKKQYSSYIKVLNDCGQDERLYYSNPVLDYDPFTGYQYKNVNILYRTRTGAPSHKIVEEYKEYYINKKVQSKLTQQRYYKAKYFSRFFPDMKDTLVRSVDNTWIGGTGTQADIYAYSIGAGCMLGHNVQCGQSSMLVETYYTDLQDMPFKSNDNLLLASSITKDYAKDTINDFLRIEKYIHIIIITRS